MGGGEGEGGGGGVREGVRPSAPEGRVYHAGPHGAAVREGPTHRGRTSDAATLPRRKTALRHQLPPVCVGSAVLPGPTQVCI